MQRVLLLSAISFLFVASAFAQSKKQAKEMKIKSATETVIVYKDGKESANYKSDYTTFDKEGNTLVQIEYNPDGSVRRRETTKYAGKEKTEEIVEHPGTSSDNNDQKKYKKTTWKYNSSGEKTEEVEYDAAGNVTKKTTYAYNSKGYRAFEMEYDGTGRLLKKSAFSYDNKGLRTEKKVYGPGDVLEKYVKYTYTY
ncbi:MAG: hypothetical protein M3R17_09920 [Bacteroidota bacterium]|nr:hypothetical protein [Bacteroidota bacterium]